MAALAGQIFGGTILVFILSWLIDRFSTREMGASVAVRAIGPTIFAVGIAIVLYGFGNANGGPWNPGSGLIAYPIGGLIVSFLRFFQLKGQEAKTSDIFE